MSKPNGIELPGAEPIPILSEDRSVLASDKPRDWMLVSRCAHFSWKLLLALPHSVGMSQPHEINSDCHRAARRN